MNSSQLKYGEIFCFLTLFFLILFLFLSHKQKQTEKSYQASSARNITLAKNLIEKNEIIGDLKRTNQALKGTIANAKKPRGIFPPNITIQNTGQYAFSLGQANLTPELREYIDEEIVPKIRDYFQNYDINTIEVIGHTDGLEIQKTTSNLDELLNKVAIEDRPIEDLRAGSNADLGLMRALAVIKELQNKEELIKIFQQKGLKQDKVFRAYSSAQLYLPNGQIAPTDPNADQERRRIEIRFTKFNNE